MKTNSFFVFLLSLLILLGCDDDDKKTNDPVSQLPPASQTGKNTFGYLLNGIPVKVTNSLSMSAIYQGGFVQLGLGNINIVILDPYTTNINYDLTNIIKSKVRVTTKIKDNNFCFYEFEDTYQGYVKISKVDRINYIISGTFEFSTVTPDCDTIKITDGRFDMQYIP